ncbi:SIMPL domain-containing protein [Aeromicrobium sp.]|uniref:SIMPL domain-containing protein n=1 Tax=Aeromicrobium sp. TaxID=1871063 RepID=UPI003C6BB12C
MALDITVRGSAEQRYPAERAVVSMAAAVESDDKQQAFSRATAIQEPLVSQLKELVELRAVGVWSSDQVRVFSHRPRDAEGNRLAVVHVARIQVSAEFTDFERLSGFLDFWSGTDAVEVSGVSWDVSTKNRRSYETEVRKAAVDDAVAKAQSYANAVRRGKVVALQIADPGMLTHPVGGRDSMPELTRVAFAESGRGPGLDLTPEDIVIHVDVDARFQSD